jgi:hypothetical protein
MEDTRPKMFVFVLMPFSSEFTDIYELGIKQASKDVGAYCERVDEQIFMESILERIYNQIAKADVIVADLTGRNPNVFYETGYAHAINKRVILLTQVSQDIPFDLKHYPHIVYGNKISLLKSQLEMKLRWCIDNPRESLYDAEASLQLFIDGKRLEDLPELKYEAKATWRVDLKVDIHNLMTKVADRSTFTVASSILCKRSSVFLPAASLC